MFKSNDWPQFVVRKSIGAQKSTGVKCLPYSFDLRKNLDFVLLWHHFKAVLQEETFDPWNATGRPMHKVLSGVQKAELSY